ncbi:hypothetical protein BSKO_08420 [Bryopsis sp. KO-2023]|nr:hypothetical protein BSKO_08420 [Bryopsis sp. KO-2023]
MRRPRMDDMELEAPGFNDLPLELLARIGQLLAGGDLLHGLLVSKAWQRGLRAGVKTANLCIPRRRKSTAWTKELSGLHGLLIDHLHIYGLASFPDDLFRGLHKSIRAFPNVCKDLLSICEGLSNLKSLMLEHVQLDGNGVQALGEFKNLKKLEISRCMVVDYSGSDVISLEHLRNLESLTVRSIEWFHSAQERCAVCPLTLSLTLPTMLTELNVTDCATGRDFLSNIPPEIKCKLRRLCYSLPLDPVAIRRWDAEQFPWVSTFFEKQLRGFRALQDLSLELIPRMMRQEEWQGEWVENESRKVEKGISEDLGNLTNLSIKWSNRFLQFTSRQPEMSDQILDIVIDIIYGCERLSDIDITIPLTTQAVATLRAIVGKPTLKSIRLDARVIGGLEDIDGEIVQLLTMLSHQSNLTTLELGLRGAQREGRVFHLLNMVDMFSITARTKHLQRLELEAWPMMGMLKSVPALPPCLKELSVQSADGLIALCGAGLSSLTRLALANTTVSPEEIRILGLLPRLEWLSMSQVDFAQEMMSESTLSKCALFASLTGLSLETKASALPKGFLSCLPTSLEHLRLRGPPECREILEASIKAMPRLVSLNLSHNSWMDNKFLEGISHLQSLRRLDVCHCPGVSGACLGLIRELRSLRKVVMSGIPDGVHDVLDWWDLEEDFPRCDIQCSCPALKSKCWWW